MANENIYWIGKGTFFIDKKPHDKNKPIPKSKVSKEFLNRNTNNGNIGSKVVSSELVSKDLIKENEALLKENESLKKALKPKEQKKESK